MSLAVEKALSDLPEGLRSDLVSAYNEVVNNYRERRWEPSELNGGKLCEAVFTVAKGFLEGGKYPERATKPRRFPHACLALEEKYQAVPNSRSPRILIPRMMLGLYDVRNNRGVGHAGGDVSPNQMDATAVLYLSKWLVAELVRLLHDLPTAEAEAVVESLIEREVEIVWRHESKRRVLRTDLTRKQEVLLLLLSVSGSVAERDLFSWLEVTSPGAFRRDVLRSMHRDRWIEYDETDRSVRLLPPGVERAEAIVTTG